MDSRASFLDDVLVGLGGAQKSIPGKYLWDEAGSRIFEAIAVSDAYYQTAAEHGLTSEALPSVSTILGPGACIVEFGSGASRKIRQLLDALDQPARYVALDISRDFLETSASRIAVDYPAVDVHAICADYSQPLPALPLDRSHQVLGFLPGTSIGNMVPDDARRLLVQLRDTLAPGLLLIGQDPNRDRVRLRAAYEGSLMTALHKNVLVRLVRELDATVHPEAFRHESRSFDDRVEPHLVATSETAIEVGGRRFELAPGESIRTDLSWKYSVDDFSALADAAGWTVARRWDDRQGCFSLYLLRSKPT